MAATSNHHAVTPSIPVQPELERFRTEWFKLLTALVDHRDGLAAGAKSDLWLEEKFAKYLTESMKVIAFDGEEAHLICHTIHPLPASSNELWSFTPPSSQT